MSDMTAPKGKAAGTPIKLAERLDFAASESLAAAIGDRRGAALQLNAGNVRFISALSAEILMRARSEWQADGLGFGVVEPSTDFLQGLALLGIPENGLIREDVE
ncbi:hypothetical protein DDZ14_14785 [Maritimibacter sp. 55A14]|uniref:STAS domain-containing protein n=1 Tax=Maritimibacter sp. 55A14 TaxID=2174844 RepID=UPI000D60D0F3|nr:STAS domain-containing protein [Maritimibacter sp. 55A14]PWE30558.1 hypothetical protein DDZ14_14785 [Maritimibacter sp. 55A14]